MLDPTPVSWDILIALYEQVLGVELENEPLAIVVKSLHAMEEYL